MKGANRISYSAKGSGLREIFPAILGILVTLLVAWGIIWSFYRHGAFDGFLSLIFPPYAIYRGSAFFWEEPAWKDKYDLRTEELAMLIAYSSNNDPVYQIESRKYVSRLKEWLSSVPKDEKEKLLHASNSLSVSLEIYLENSLANVINDSEKDPLNDPRIKQNEAVFNKIYGFSKIWDATINEVNIFDKFASESNLKDKYTDSEKKGIFISKAKAISASQREKMSSTIKSIFY